MGTSRAAELLESLTGREDDEPRRWRSIGRTGSESDTSVEEHRTDGFLKDGAARIVSRVTARIGNTGGPLRVPPLLIMVVVGLVVIFWWMLAAPDPIEERMRPVSATDVERMDDLLDASGSSADVTDGGDITVGDPLGPGGEAVVGGPVGETGTGWITVHVAGAVVSPGVVQLPVGSRVDDAVRAAGGLRIDADPDRMNLATVLGDGWRVLVPVQGQEHDADVVVPDMDPGWLDGPPLGYGDPAWQIEDLDQVDVNTATADELQTLPGVGPATAAAIIAKRQADGPFRSVDSLIEVRGIGQVKLEGMRDLVTVD